MRTLTRSIIGVGMLAGAVIGVIASSAPVQPGQDQGKELAEKYCATCHVQPQPDVLDRATWVAKVFPTMRQYIGLDPVKDLGPMEHDLRAFFPLFPQMTEDEWFAIASYYLDNAPPELRPAPRPHIELDKGRWKTEVSTITAQPPLTTLCKLDATRSLLLVGDGLQARFTIVGLDGKVITGVDLVGPASSAVPTSTGWLVTDMGKLLPHDSAVGALWNVRWEPSTRTAMASRLLDTLRRPTHVAVADLDGDKRDDYVVCEYGNMLGRFGIYSAAKNGRVSYRELIPRPGAIRSQIRDINNDGRPDIVVLMAQAREGIYAFINRGKGRFDEVALATYHPAFGSSGFDLVDFDADGDLDLVVSNGDNGDYEQPPYKPYHGTHLLVNDGSLRFTEQTFLPQNGAYGSVMRDFDLDGDLDIFSIAYFPDYRVDASESVLYWERQTDGSYRPFTIADPGIGRWLVYDCADVDQDGDLDMLLGNTSMGPGNTTPALRERWKAEGRAYILLRNTTK